MQVVKRTFVDDLDGSEGDDVQPVQFGLDGLEFQIDLGRENADRLRDALEEFIVHGRRTGGRAKPGTARHLVAAATTVVAAASKGPRGKRGKDAAPPAPPAPNREHNAAVRAWASQNGYVVGDKGRIPLTVQRAFEEAHTSSRGRG